MLNIDLIRENSESVRTMLVNRNYPEDALDSFLKVDLEWRILVEEREPTTSASESGG